jgi:hypothetical protein
MIKKITDEEVLFEIKEMNKISHLISDMLKENNIDIGLGIRTLSFIMANTHLQLGLSKDGFLQRCGDCWDVMKEIQEVENKIGSK